MCVYIRTDVHEANARLLVHLGYENIDTRAGSLVRYLGVQMYGCTSKETKRPTCHQRREFG